MKVLTNQKGFTLVEIIISLAILGIIVISFTTLFTSSISGIFSAGKKSKALHEAQMQMEGTIATDNSPTQNNTPTKDNMAILTNTEEYQLEINFPDSSLDPIYIEGKKKTIEVQYNNRQVSLTCFIPER